MIAEPDVTLSDWALAVECTAFAIALPRTVAAPLRPWWVAFFGSLGAGALLGGLVHGFFPDPPPPAGLALWRATLLAIGLTALAAWGLGARLALRPRPARTVVAAAGVGWVAYAAVVLWVRHDFAVALVGYLPVILVLGAALAARGRATGARIALAGLTHNALYHVITGAGLALLFAGARHLEPAWPRRGTLC